MSKTELEKVIETFNKVLEEQPEFQIEYEMPNWRYWVIPKNWKKTKYIFGWTTQRDHNGKFHALKYRILQDGSYKLSKSVAFGRRKVAKARSEKWFDKYYKIKEMQQK